MGKFNNLFTLNKTLIDISSIFIRLARFPYQLQNKNNMAKNNELKKYKKSDTCYILGLGPSLKGVDLSKIDGDTFAINTFYNFSEASSISPTFYCITDDRDFWDPTSDLLDKATKKFPDAAFLFNGKYRKQAEARIAQDVKRYYAYMWAGYFKPNKRIDYQKLLPIMGNIVCFAIMTAFYLGYKKIYLLGCDFNSFAFRTQAHCYDEKHNERVLRLSYELFCYAFCADTHDMLAQYANSNGIQIINATKGSLIDAYPYDETVISYFLKKDR
jgi:hypothetical protein